MIDLEVPVQPAECGQQTDDRPFGRIAEPLAVEFPRMLDAGTLEGHDRERTCLVYDRNTLRLVADPVVGINGEGVREDEIGLFGLLRKGRLTGAG